MSLLKNNIIPILIYVIAGLVLFSASYIPSYILTTILRVLGAISAITPFAVLSWIIIKGRIK